MARMGASRLVVAEFARIRVFTSLANPNSGEFGYKTEYGLHFLNSGTS